MEGNKIGWEDIKEGLKSFMQVLVYSALSMLTFAAVVYIITTFWS